MISLRENHGRILAAVLTLAVAAYIGWKVNESGQQALQFTFNGLAVGAIYALLAMGFTLVYSTVWFFDLYYGAAAALGAYGVFYLRTPGAAGDRFDVNNIYVNIVFALVVAGVVAWALYMVAYPRLSSRLRRSVAFGLGALLAAGAGVYTGFILAYPSELYIMLSPAVGLLVTAALGLVLARSIGRITGGNAHVSVLTPALLAAAGAGAYCGLLVAGHPGANLYLSWAVSCFLAGAVGLALYRGLYVYMRQRARSPLIMLVASLGIILAITAFTVIVFQSAARPLPEAFGSSPWSVGGANIKGFNVFTIGVAVAGFAALLFLLKRTTFGKAVRAIGDDEDVSKVVGINTTFVIAVVFFIGAVYAAAAGVLSGHDTAIQPKMGLLLLLKGWIASVVGGIGNMYGAILGGFVLGLIEQFGIWDLAGEWKDAISFVILILFLSFWPQGLLPRR